MSPLALESTDLCRVLGQIAAGLAAHSEEIRELDAKVGDGDLGITVGLIAKALTGFAETTSEVDIGRLLMHCGIAVNRSNPSTFATILASGFMGGGKAVVGKTSVGLSDWVAIGESAVDSMQGRGKASVGDKTLLDTLVPAVAALKAEAGKASDERTAVRAALQAAEQGMKATTDMVARVGRARAFQERSVGVQDGGATAVFYMIKAFAEFVDVSLQSES
jgi:dihydroxyacetone kinase-like protein